MRFAIAAVCLLAAAAGAPREEPRYEIRKTEVKADVLLAVEADAWNAATPITWGPAGYETTFRGAWNDEGLFVVFEAVDPSPWHTFEKRDDRLWDEEVVEIFLDLDRSGTHYAEVEISPANVVCDLHILYPLPMKDGDPEWKGDRAWNYEGLVSRAEIHKDKDGRTTGWRASAFLPWSGLASLPSAKHVSLPPKPGDVWRFNVFRIERPHGPEEPERDTLYLAWSPAPIPKFHVASTFRDLVFR
jgi:hypothetical protein